MQSEIKTASYTQEAASFQNQNQWFTGKASNARAKKQLARQSESPRQQGALNPLPSKRWSEEQDWRLRRYC